MKKKTITTHKTARKSAEKGQHKAENNAVHSVFQHLPAGKKLVLHCSHGMLQSSAGLYPAFQGDDWHSITVNAHDKAMLSLSPEAYHTLPPQCLDAIWMGHFLERFNVIAIQKWLKTLPAILKHDAQLVVQVPNMEILADSVAKKGLNKAMVKTQQGVVYAREFIHGFDRWVISDPHAQHLSSFTPSMLASLLESAGFVNIRVDGSALMMLASGRVNHAKQKDAKSKPPFVKRPDYNSMMVKRDHMDQPANYVKKQ